MNLKMKTEQVRDYAFQKHKDVNQMYDGNPYSLHLRMVHNIAQKYIYLCSDNDFDQMVILSAIWCHDLIEDARLTYNDLVTDLTQILLSEYKNYGTHTQGMKNRICHETMTATKIADIVYAVSNEKGKNRGERANDKYYCGIRTTQFATFVKLCDRAANVTYSNLLGNDRMLQMYQKESKSFLKHLIGEENATEVAQLSSFLLTEFNFSV